MLVRASVNLPGNTPSDPAFVVGRTKEVDSRSAYIQRLLAAGYLVQVDTPARRRVRKTGQSG